MMNGAALNSTPMCGMRKYNDMNTKKKPGSI